MSRIAAVLLVSGALLSGTGCPSRKNVESVSGTVTLDGKAAPGTIIGFWPADPNAVLGANNYGRVVADTEGRFAVTGDAINGFAAGDYRLTFSRVLDGNGKPEPDAKPGENRCRETLSAAYLDPDKSGVRVTLVRPETTLTLELKTAGMPPPPPPPSSAGK